MFEYNKNISSVCMLIVFKIVTSLCIEHDLHMFVLYTMIANDSCCVWGFCVFFFQMPVKPKHGA